MKKVMTLMITATMIFTSCSKERTFNKKLEGDWNVTSLRAEVTNLDGTFVGVGEVISDGNTMVYSFGRDKKDNGTLKMDLLIYGERTTYSGAYTLTKDEKITIIEQDGSPFVFTILNYSKTDMTLQKPDGYNMILKKK